MPRKNDNPDEGPWGPILDILDDIRNTGGAQPKPPAEQDDKQPTEDEDERAIVAWILKECERQGIHEDDE